VDDADVRLLNDNHISSLPFFLLREPKDLLLGEPEGLPLREVVLFGGFHFDELVQLARFEVEIELKHEEVIFAELAPDEGLLLAGEVGVPDEILPLH